MANTKEIYFRDSVINLRKKYSVMRRLAVPVTDGVELLTGGDFSDAGAWAVSTGVAILPAQKRAVWTAGNNNTIQQSAGIIKSSWYRLELDVIEYQQGNLKFQAGSEGRPVTIDTSQNHFSADLYSNGNDVIYIFGVDNFRGSIANLTLKKLVFYEDEWVDITNFTYEKTLSGVNKSLDYKAWEFGEVKQDNASLKLLNVYGEMSDEENEESFWYNGYQRHQSKIKIEAIFNDSASNILFNGLLDDRSATTTVEGTQPIIENITAFSYSKILSDITISELGTISGSTVNELVFNIMNRGFFTDFFRVDYSNIKAGYNAVVDFSVYEQGDKIIDVLKDLAKGHSIFYVDTEDSFHFKPVEATEEVVMELGLFPERKIKLYDYRSGSERVVENFYWEEGSEKYEKPQPKYRTSKTIEVKAIVDGGYRQGLLNYIGERFSKKLFSFKVDIPLCPFVDILDRVKVQQIGSLGKNAFILNVSCLDTFRLELPVGAVRITTDSSFIVYGVNHNESKTSLTLLQLSPDDYRRLKFGLVSCWEFQNNANDRMGANNGAGSNMVYEAAPKDFDLGGRVAVFNGVNSYINVPYSASLAPAGKELSIEVWANIEQAGTSIGRLFSKTQNGGYSVQLTDGIIRSYIWQSSRGDYSVAQAAHKKNVWAQYVFVYNGFDNSIFIDGQKIASVPGQDNLLYSVNNSLLIGAEVGSGATPDGDYFKGKIASIKFYNRELSPSEIRQLYNGGRGLSYRTIFNS